MKGTFRRLAALILALGVLMTAALALTPEELGDLLREYYVTDVPDRVWERDTVEGMLAALGDPYTVYLSEEEYGSFMGHLTDSENVGMGVRGTFDGSNGFLVDSVFPNSPAAAAGILPGERILALDGAPLTREQAGSFQVGETHTVTIEDKQGNERTVEMTMRSFVYPTAYLMRVEDKTAYININTFGAATYRQVYEILTDKTVTDEAECWVLDLRDNGGGMTYPAVFIPGAFLGKNARLLNTSRGEVLGEFRPDPEYLRTLDFGGALEIPDGAAEAYNAAGSLVEGPLFVLVNGESASSSELLSSLAKELGAILVGERTYGKGIGQSLMDESAFPEIFDGDALKVTTLKLYRNSGATFHTLGLIPNFVVPGGDADRVAALLSSPLDGGDTVTVDVPGGTTNAVTLPVSAAEKDPEAMTLLLEALTPECRCRYQDRVLTAPELAQALELPYESRWFTDVDDSPYSFELNALATFDVLHGREDGRYMPEATLTRAEAVALVQKAFGPRQWWGAFATYDDVEMAAWYYPALCAVEEVGWLQGDEKGLFHPNDTMTHQEFLTLMTRILRAVSWNYSQAAAGEGAPGLETLAERYPAYAEWALDALWQAEDFAWDAVKNIDPLAPVTREEAGAAAYNLLYLLDLV